MGGPAIFGGLSDWLIGLAQNSQPFLSLLLLVSICYPLATAISLAISGKLSGKSVQITGLLGFFVPFLIAVFLTAVYTASEDGSRYTFLVDIPMGLEAFGIRLFLGLNGVGLALYLLAGVVGLAAGMYAVQSGMERLRSFLVLLLVMQSGLMGIFSSIDLFFFYFFHEFALIPTFVMIAIWGRRGRKSVAIELTIYLTFGAMLTLAGLIALYVWSGATEFNIIALRMAMVEAENQGIIFGLLLIGFGVLVSLFPFHSWAPRGYATAPAPVAMLHAGVLKKFGLYGLIQIALPMLPHGFGEWAPLLLWLALGNILIIGAVTLAQRDLKLMLGNASVMHMGYAFLGLYAYTALGVGAALLMLFAHGLSVALLFLLADVVEKRTGSLDFEDLGGLGTHAPVLMGLFVAAMMASIGLPGFANFWGELGIFISLYGTPTPWIVFAAILGIIISAVYGLRAVAKIFFGEAPAREESEGPIHDIGLGEKLPALLLLGVLFLVGIWPKVISGPVNKGIETLFEAKPPVLLSQTEEPIQIDE